jgi:hypothetical protein
MSPPVFVAGGTVPLPPDNHPDNGILGKWSPVFTIPASSDYYLIKITGKISHDWNEQCPVWQCPNTLDGATLGSMEGGAGLVDLGYAPPGVDVAGGASPTRYYAEQHPDGNGTAFVLARASYARTVWARRSGLGTGCLQSGGSCDPNNRQPQYFLSGQQSVTLHSIPVPLSVTAPAAVATGQPGTFTSTIVENLPVDVDADGSKRIFWYFMEGDTLATPGGGTSRNVPCTAYATCSYSPAKSGRMKVAAYVQGYVLEGYSQIVRVKQPELVLTCNGQRDSVVVERGSIIDCRANSDPPDPLMQVLGWSFSDGGDFQVPAAGAPAITTTAWAGKVVRDGTITVRAIVGGTEKTQTMILTVGARSWSWGSADWSISHGTADHCQPAYNSPEPGAPWGWNRRVSSCDPGRIDPNVQVSPDAGYRIESIGSGPNTGLWFVASATYRIDRATGILSALKPGAPLLVIAPGAHSSCVSALGTDSVNFHGFNTACMAIDLDPLHQGILNHEGFGSTGVNGHEAQARIAAARPENDPRRRIESFSFPNESDLRLWVREAVQVADHAISAAGASHSVVNGNFSGTIWVWDPASSTFYSYTPNNI